MHNVVSILKKKKKTHTKLRYGGDPGIEKMNTKNSKMCLQIKENKQFQVNCNGLKF